MAKQNLLVPSLPRPMRGFRRIWTRPEMSDLGRKPWYKEMSSWEADGGLRLLGCPFDEEGGS